MDHTPARKKDGDDCRPMFEFRLPTRSTSVPDTPDWLHEIKYEGCRPRVERDGDRVRLIIRGSHNWADRYSLISAAARKLKAPTFVIDGEAVSLDTMTNLDLDHEPIWIAYLL
jgi:ATP-dependent DNA ligase